MPRRTVDASAANPADLAKYITIDQAAAALAVDRKTIRRKIARGELPAVRIGTRTPGTVRDIRPIRIQAAAIHAILEPIGSAL